ncbi:replicase [Camellia ringspot associated virus 4]|uniref:Replicase n=1 Tax=Camellia ringspot associated virus 4 TaxID=2791164 RepID=A0A7S9TQF3_9VIRU|nr:replicase [Camellia ringspot associated virus 4]QPI34838.1 replicase [Camellia ringspot associated virus 4]
MAFTFKTPAEEVLNRFTSEEQSRVSAVAVSTLANIEKHDNQLFGYSVPEKAKEKLSTSGIYLSPFSLFPPSHPVCKILENNMLFKVVASKLDNSFSLVSIKESKLNLLKSRDRSISMIECLNRYVTSADVYRYGSFWTVSSSKEIEGFRPKCSDVLSNVTLKNLIPGVVRSNSKKIFLHDELHYWSHRDLISFLREVEPNVVLATIVFPPEILAGSKTSLNPWCYTFEIYGDDLIFSPDGVASESYTQPLSGSYLLRTSTVNCGQGLVYHIDIVKTTFAHHLISITKGRKVPQKYKCFSNFEAVSIKELEGLSNTIRDALPVSYDVVSKIYMYMRSLKSPDNQSCMAKLRQLVSQPSGTEIKFVEDFGRLLINCKSMDSMLLPEIGKLIKCFFISMLPSKLSRLFRVYQSASLDMFITNLKPFKFSVNAIEINWDHKERSLPIFHGLEDEVDPENCLDLMDRFTTGKVLEEFDHDRGEYTMDINQFSFETLIDYDDVTIQDRIFSCLFEAYSNSFGFYSKNEEFVLRGCLMLKKSIVGSNSVNVSNFKRGILRKLSGKLRSMIGLWKIYFSSNLKQWFFCSNLRAYQKFLSFGQREPMDVSVSKTFAKVMSEITSSKESHSLRVVGRYDLFGSGNSHVDVNVQTRSIVLNKAVNNLSEDSEAFISQLNLIEGSSRTEDSKVSINEGNEIENQKFELCEINMQHDVETSNLQNQEEERGNKFVGFNLNSEESNIVMKTEAPTSHAKSEVNEVVEATPARHVILDMPSHLSVPAGKIDSDDLLFGRVVEEDIKHGKAFDSVLRLDLGEAIGIKLKGREAFFFSRCGCIEYGHDKVKYVTNLWPKELDQFVVGDDDYYNTCLVQVYNSADGIPFHADDEKCYQDTPVKTVNYGGGVFQFKKKSRRTDLGWTHKISMSNGQCFTMKPHFQRLYKHSVTNVQIGRVSLTFRRQDFDLKGKCLEHRCMNEFEENLFGVNIRRSNKYKFDSFSLFDVPGDGNCFWHAIGSLCGQSSDFLREAARDYCSRQKIKGKQVDEQMKNGTWAEREAIAVLSRMLSFEIIVLMPELGISQIFTPDSEDYVTFFLSLSKNHFQPALPKNGCVVKALSQALNRKEAAILSVFGREENRYLLEVISEGNGLGIEDIERVMEIFGLRCELVTPKGTFRLNPEGKMPVVMELSGEHILFVETKQRSFGSLRAQSRVTNIPEFGVGEQLRVCSDSAIYKPSVERASRLAESYLDGTTGVICSRLIEQQGDWLKVEDTLNFKERELNLILGTYGSGKSTLFKKFIASNPSRQVVFVSPRRELAKAVQRDILSDKSGKKSVHSAAVKTLETFLKVMKHTHNRSIIFDEIQLFPPGYLDLVLINLSDGNQVFLTGDPCQSKYDSASDRHIIGDMTPDIINVLQGRKYRYNVLSHRFQSRLFINRLSCVVSQKAIKFDTTEYDYYCTLSEAAKVSKDLFDCVLVSSFEEKKAIYSYFGRDCKCHTFGESTGLTYDSGFIMISHESISSGEDRWITALSRFRKGVMFINLLSDNLNDVAQTFHGRALYRFLCEQANLSDLLKILPGSPQFVEGFGNMIGKDEGVKEMKLSGDPWLKADIFLGQTEDMEEEENSRIVQQAVEFSTHLSIIQPETIRSVWTERIKLKDSRETRVGMDVSTQFTDQHSKNKGEVLSNAAERFESIYPRHNGRDSVTFLMAVRKRLRFSKPEIEAKKLKIAEKYGKFLLDEFLSHVKIDPRRNQKFMDDSLREFEEKKTSKSTATIENHSNRSCRDWFSDFALIFMKSQFCSKWDNRFRDSKAGQTLACFSHSVLCRFAPYIRYIEKKLFEALPPNLYIHSGKGLEVLEEWVIKSGFNGECTESDYEAFDASQDQYTLAFELAVMRFLQLPKDLIEDYKFLKLNLGSKLGNFAIMRFTGEASTFLFNTMANMLFTFLRYDLNGKESICFAGDDMCANKRLKIKRAHESFLGKIKLKAKVAVTSHPTFCGWNLSYAGIYKKPQLVYERLCVARETNNLKNCIDSYAIEVAYGYKLGELLHDLMDGEELENHYSCVRFIIKNSSLLKSNVLDVFCKNLKKVPNKF